MKKIIIVGGGGHSKVVASIIMKTDVYELVGYSDKISQGDILGKPHIGTDETIITNFNRERFYLALGVGKINRKDIRLKIVSRFLDLGYDFPAIISPGANVNHSRIKKGAVVFDGVVVNPGCIISEFAIINSNATVEHDVEIGRNTHLAPGVVVCGDCKIGSNVMIGANSTIIQGISITDNVLIGAGSTVLRSITESGVYVGSPVKKVK